MLNIQNRNQKYQKKREVQEEENEIKIDKDLPWQSSSFHSLSRSHIHLLESVKRYENIMNSFNSIIRMPNKGWQRVSHISYSRQYFLRGFLRTWNKKITGKWQTICFSLFHSLSLTSFFLLAHNKFECQ